MGITIFFVLLGLVAFISIIYSLELNSTSFKFKFILLDFFSKFSVLVAIPLIYLISIIFTPLILISSYEGQIESISGKITVLQNEIVIYENTLKNHVKEYEELRNSLIQSSNSTALQFLSEERNEISDNLSNTIREHTDLILQQKLMIEEIKGKLFAVKNNDIFL